MVGPNPTFFSNDVKMIGGDSAHDYLQFFNWVVDYNRFGDFRGSVSVDNTTVRTGAVWRQICHWAGHAACGWCQWKVGTRFLI